MMWDRFKSDVARIATELTTRVNQELWPDTSNPLEALFMTTTMVLIIVYCMFAGTA